MARCPKCGYQVTESMRFCSFCGSKIKTNTEFQREPLMPVEKASAFRVISVIATISGIIGILTYLCHLAVLQQKTRTIEYVNEFDEYMIYLLIGSAIIMVVGIIGLNIKNW